MKVALKEVYAAAVTGELDELKHEAQLLVKMQHPNVVHFYGVSQSPPGANGQLDVGYYLVRSLVGWVGGWVGG